ncbi:MAG: glycosyltransferase [bacterium]|nr:glycosyltransferase [bacterium]
MKVAIFTNAYRPLVSGVVNSVELIRRGLIRTGNIPYVFAPHAGDYKDTQAGVWRFRSVSLTQKVEFPIAIPYSTRIFPMIPRMGIDVIHTHHPFLLGEVGAFFAKHLQVPLVYTFHTQLEKYAHYIPLPSDLVRKAARDYVTAYTKKCSCIICPSPAIRGLLDEYGVTCRVEVLQNAIDVKAYRKADGSSIRRSLGLTDELLCIFTGRMGIEKNLSFMLRSFKKAHSHFPKLRLMLLGDGPIWEELKLQAIDLDIADYVFFPGRVSYAEIPAYYAAADLFVMTSTTEVKPLAVLEGMAAGLPVIAVDACGTGDTVTNGHDGLLSECNETAYTAIWEKAAQDDALRETMGKNAALTAEQYSLDNYMQKLLALYRELGAKDTPRGSHHNLPKTFQLPGLPNLP